ncbi:MAG: hypothetical protein ACK5OX_14925 [Desertimonas sp.]
MTFTGTSLVMISQRGDQFIVQASDLSRRGTWQGNTHIDLLPLDVTDEMLGRAISTARGVTRIGVESPPSRAFGPGLAALLEAAGVKSLNQYMRGTRQVTITFYSDRPPATTSWKNNGAKGFVPIPDADDLPVDSTDEPGLGRAVREALGRST